MDLHAAQILKRQAELDELNAKLKTLELKAESRRPAQEVQLYAQLQDAQSRVTDVRRKIEELRTAGDKHWDEMKPKLEAAWNELRGSLERVEQNVR